MQIKIKLSNDAFMPERAHSQDAGYDLRTPIDFTLEPGGFRVIDTGVSVQLPLGKCAVVISKSGLYTSSHITSTGLIDEGYTGTIRIGVANHSGREYTFKRGDKISQFYITDYYACEIVPVDQLDESDRGTNGFGSTGK